VWASANAASLLHVTARLRNTNPPTALVIEEIRDKAMQSISKPEEKGSSK
jgi:hypothetical protein